MSFVGRSCLALALWLVWSGVAWLGLAAYRFHRHGFDRWSVVLPVAALAGWAALLRLTTAIFGGAELVPLDPSVATVHRRMPHRLERELETLLERRIQAIHATKS